MNQFNAEYYGDNVRWFMGTVIDGSPPPGLEGRVKVHIHGIHSEDTNDIPQAHLPWAQVMMPGTMHGVSGLGGNPQLMPGALVFGVFLDGRTSQLPFVLGSLPKVEFPTPVQAQGRDDPTTNPNAYDIYQRYKFGIERGSTSFFGEIETGYENINEESLERKREISMKFFIDNGFSDIVSAGIVGNLEMVSNLDSTFFNGEVTGLGGWSVLSDRWKRYLNYSGRFFQNANTTDFEVQLNYILLELRTTKSLTVSKLLKANSIKGEYNGIRIDNVVRGLGSAELFRRYYFSPVTRENYTNKELAESISELAYNSIWS